MVDEAKETTATAPAAPSAVGAVAGTLNDPASGLEITGAAAGAAVEGTRQARLDFLIAAANRAAKEGKELDFANIDSEILQLGGKLNPAEKLILQGKVAEATTESQLRKMFEAAQPEQSQFAGAAAAVINPGGGAPAIVGAGAVTGTETTTASGEPAAKVDMAAAGAVKPEDAPAAVGAAAGTTIVPESKAKEMLGKLGIEQKATGLAM